MPGVGVHAVGQQRGWRVQNAGFQSMKLALDSCYYHQFSGLIYLDLERDPGCRMMLGKFIERAQAHPTDGHEDAAAGESGTHLQHLLPAAGPITGEGKAT